MNVFRAAFVLEVTTASRSQARWTPLITAPLYTAMFLAITIRAGRQDLANYAVLAPALMVLWRHALFEAGEVIDRERWEGTLEAMVATPASISAVVLGRVLAIIGYGSLGFLSSWAMAAMAFGIVVPIAHPGWFVATLAATVFAMAGTATIMAAVFVLARSARTFQNTLSYPVFVLGGVLVPVALLPGWVQPISRGVFLSWSSDLLRDSLDATSLVSPWPRLGMVVLLGVAGFILGRWTLARILDRVRVSGTLTTA